jgi:hypothetical protein
LSDHASFKISRPDDAAPTPPPRPDVRDGDWVRAFTLQVTGSDRVIAPPGAPVEVRGNVTVHRIEVNDTWRYSVRGLTVDPATIEVLDEDWRRTTSG